MSLLLSVEDAMRSAARCVLETQALTGPGDLSLVVYFKRNDDYSLDLEVLLGDLGGGDALLSAVGRILQMRLKDEIDVAVEPLVIDDRERAIAIACRSDVVATVTSRRRWSRRDRLVHALVRAGQPVLVIPPDRGRKPSSSPQTGP